VWFAFRFDGEAAEFDLAAHGEPEFEAWRWGYLAEAPELVVPFKRPAYEAVAAAFAGFAAKP
jgi:putative (di)nucleoside polyphosphate hydrolase